MADGVTGYAFRTFNRT